MFKQCKDYNTCNLPPEIGKLNTEIQQLKEANAYHRKKQLRNAEQIDTLKDRLHRRNMQIKDLKVKLEPKCSINKNHTIVDKGYDCLECNTHYC